MPYHINDEGNVGECDAEIRCPFGDFDTQHYTTREDAQRAYEAAMRGETFKPGLVSSEAPAPAVRPLSKKVQKKRSKVAEYMGSLPALPYVNKGYYTSPYPLRNARPGMAFEGGVVREVQDGEETKTVTVAFPDPNDQYGAVLETYTFAMATVGNVDDRSTHVWVNQTSPEDEAVREVAARERNLETSLKFVCADVKRKLLLKPYETEYTSDGGLRVKFFWSPRNELAKAIRGYKAMVEDAKTAGVANPHTFALRRYKDSIPEVHPSYEDHRDWPNAQPAFSRFVTDLLEQKSVALSHVSTAWLEDGFNEGERPWLDYTFDEIGSRSV